MGEDGESVGEERVVEDEEEVRLEVSSAPEEVTSIKVFVAAMCPAVGGVVSGR